MAIRLKGWTTRLATKAVCFVLAVLAAAGCVFGAFQAIVYFDDTGVSPDVLFMGPSSATMFFNSNIYNTASNAQILINLVSEEQILAGGSLFWNEYENEAVLYGDYYGDYWISKANDTPERRLEIENEMIGQQLEHFRRVQKNMDTVEGLHYYLRIGSSIYGNTALDPAFFEGLPVYYAARNHEVLGSSHNTNLFTRGDDYELYLGYSSDVVNAEGAANLQARSHYTACIVGAAVSFVILIASLVILCCGAGRRYGEEGSVRFLVIDRPFHDIVLFVGVCLSALVVLGVWRLSEQLYWYSGNFDVAIYWILLGTAVIAAMLIYWLQTCAKRVKDKSFWRHTFIYVILKYAGKAIIWLLLLIWRIVKLFFKALRHAFRSIGDFFRGLWAGSALTLKVAAIVIVTAVVLLISAVGLINYNYGFSFILNLLFLAAVTVLLLRYARRLRTLEISAQKISQGAYAERLDVGGGELGSVAESINNISSGISVAVDERMKSERLKTELITNVSHDIRTPLTSIITYTDLLKNEGLTSRRAPEYLEVLITKSARLKSLTDELFEAAKAASGSVEVHLEPINLTQLLQQVFGEADERIKSSGLDFRLNVPESAWVMADGKLLWRVIENLLSNVFKYSLTGSRVYVEVKEDGGNMRLEMKNISREPLNIDPRELTERFKRGDDSRSSEGSGLGLSIVQSFVEAQGGSFAPSIDGDLFKAGLLLPRVS